MLHTGAERLLRHFEENNIPIALATSSSQESSDLKTQRWKHIFDLFHHKVYGGSDPEVPHGKPSPDIFLVAAKRFPDNPDPSKVCSMFCNASTSQMYVKLNLSIYPYTSRQCLVFEDAPNGVQAAVAAKMQVVMVPHPQLPKHLIKDATLVLESLEDFKPECFGLPKFVM